MRDFIDEAGGVNSYRFAEDVVEMSRSNCKAYNKDGGDKRSGDGCIYCNTASEGDYGAMVAVVGGTSDKVETHGQPLYYRSQHSGGDERTNQQNGG